MAVKRTYFAYNGAFEEGGINSNTAQLLALDALNTDVIEHGVMTSPGFNDVFEHSSLTDTQRLQIMARMFKHCDHWGNDNYNKYYDWSSKGMGENWDRGPSAYGAPDLVLNYSVHCFPQTDAFFDWYYCEMEKAARSTELPCVGVSNDDYFYRRYTWKGPSGEASNNSVTEAVKRLVWGPMNGRAGYDHYPESATWNKPRMDAYAARLATLAAVTGKKFLFNAGDSTETLPELYGGARLWESVGKWIDVSDLGPSGPGGGVKDGDIVLVYGRDYNSGSPQWAEVLADDYEVTLGHMTTGQSYQEIYEDVKTAIESAGVDASVAVGWYSESATGDKHGVTGSTLSNIELPATLDA